MNEGYLRSTLAAAEHDLGVGDWKADLNRANQLLAQCETLVELQTTKAPADCRAQRQFNEQAAAEFAPASAAASKPLAGVAGSPKRKARHTGTWRNRQTRWI